MGRALLLSILSLPISCTTNPELNLAGTWRGQWTSGETAGNLEVTFAGKKGFGDMILYDVTLIATGASCPAGEDRGAGDRTAAFDQDTVHFVVRVPGGAGGDGIFQFDGALNGGGEIDGTYRLSSEACPACVCGLGTTGIWTVLR